jgi:trehalose 6-phosphate phosphatase
MYPCVIISGRAQMDVERRLNEIGVCRVVGNHGAEPLLPDAALRRRVRGWLPTLRARLGSCRGVVIEDKHYSVAVHYRNAPRRSLARRHIASVLHSLRDVHNVGGKFAFNLVVPGAPHKGEALQRERRRFSCDTAIYVGDDATDEDAFKADPAGRVLSIRVGRKRASAASYYIRNQAEIDRLLLQLVDLRRG